MLTKRLMIEEYDASVSKFTWDQWAETAYKWRICIVNWPNKLKPPGRGFNIRELGDGDLEPIVLAYIRHCKEETQEIYPQIIPLSEGERKSMHSGDSYLIASIRGRQHVELWQR